MTREPYLIGYARVSKVTINRTLHNAGRSMQLVAGGYSRRPPAVVDGIGLSSWR
ncbi:hypothetical protein QP185_22010 [Sphingomonas aerolata]